MTYCKSSSYCLTLPLILIDLTHWNISTIWRSSCIIFLIKLSDNLNQMNQMYSTNCDQLIACLISTKSHCLSPDAVKHSIILRETRDIWRLMHPFINMFWHNGWPLFYCDKSQINHDITQLYMLPFPLHGGDGIVLI